MKTNNFFLRCLLYSALVFSICSCSTSTETAIQKILGDSASAPVFIDCRAVSSTEIVFSFSLPVKVIALYLDPDSELKSITDGQEVIVSLMQPLPIGEKITADILVEDEYRNTLNVLVPFRTRNDRLPNIIINELRTEYSKPRTEFIEFFTFSEGNLGALRLFIAGFSLTNPAYEFPPVEVKAGEYIVLHLRTLETGCIDELGDDLSLSDGTDALDTARDLWISGSAKMLHKTDAVYLIDQDEKIISAVLMSENPDLWWDKQYMAAAAELLGKQGAWLPPEGEPGENYIPGPSEAVSTQSVKTAATRSVSRDESADDSRRAQDWYVSATSNATPGKPNSTKRQE
ncbi:MAG: hypothetical protein LBH43_13135 [Treponema sp.]|jgi:hypothetical protein|nr:hypothetical protein [Treponema sp.]